MTSVDGNSTDSPVVEKNAHTPATSPKPALAQAGLECLPEISPDLFAIVEQQNYQLEYINPAGRKLLGLSDSENFQERSLMEFIPGQCLWTLLNDAVPTAWRVGSWSGDLYLRHLEGKECAVSVSLIARAASPGTDSRERLWLMARDISSTQSAIEALKRDQWYLRALLENIPDSIYFKDLSSRFVRVSHAMSKVFGLGDPKLMEGKRDFDFFTGDDAKPAFDAEQEIIRTERPIIDVEEKQSWPDGRVTWTSATKLPLYNEYGQVIGTFGISRDITGRKHTETALAQSQRNLIEASRLAGMAEVASGVLHNIGNAFNSVSTSAAVVTEQASNLKVMNFARAVNLMQEHTADLPNFLSIDPRGKQLPNYLAQLSAQFCRDHQALVTELRSLSKSVDHIKNVIAMQQNYARVSSFSEELSVPELVGEALQISEAALARHNINLVRDFQEVPRVKAARHKVLEILVNLIGNANHAVDEAGRSDKCITIAIRPTVKSCVQIAVRDNGIGIPPENLRRIFSFGFTTKQNGHGFGLHSSAVAAQEMDGSLVAYSAGRGSGAEFVLELPAVTPSGLS